LENFRGRARDVTITFLPGDNYRHNVEDGVRAARGRLESGAHIAAREIASTEALDDFLARLRGEADVTRVLLIRATSPRRGARSGQPRYRDSGLLQAHGITRVGVAGHPEGHPYLDEALTFALLAGWRDWGATDPRPASRSSRSSVSRARRSRLPRQAGAPASGFRDR